jgi:hypothetical protein
MVIEAQGVYDAPKRPVSSSLPPALPAKPSTPPVTEIGVVTVPDGVYEITDEIGTSEDVQDVYEVPVPVTSHAPVADDGIYDLPNDEADAAAEVLKGQEDAESSSGSAAEDSGEDGYEEMAKGGYGNPLDLGGSASDGPLPDRPPGSAPAGSPKPSRPPKPSKAMPSKSPPELPPDEPDDLIITMDDE